MHSEKKQVSVRLVTSYSFKDASPIMKRVRHHRHSSFIPADDLSIHPHKICLLYLCLCVPSSLLVSLRRRQHFLIQFHYHFSNTLSSLAVPVFLVCSLF